MAAVSTATMEEHHIPGRTESSHSQREVNLSLFQECLVAHDTPVDLAGSLKMSPTIYYLPSSLSNRLSNTLGLRLCVRVGNELRFTWDVVRSLSDFRIFRRDLLKLGVLTSTIPCQGCAPEKSKEHIKKLNEWLLQAFDKWQTPQRIETKFAAIKSQKEVNLTSRAFAIAMCFETLCFDAKLRRIASAHVSHSSQFHSKLFSIAPHRIRDMVDKCMQQGFTKPTENAISQVSENADFISSPPKVDELVKEATIRLNRYASEGNIYAGMKSKLNYLQESEVENYECKDKRKSWSTRDRRRSLASKMNLVPRLRLRQRQDGKPSSLVKALTSTFSKTRSSTIPEEPTIEHPDVSNVQCNEHEVQEESAEVINDKPISSDKNNQDEVGGSYSFEIQPKRVDDSKLRTVKSNLSKCFSPLSDRRKQIHSVHPPKMEPKSALSAAEPKSSFNVCDIDGAETKTLSRRSSFTDTSRRKRRESNSSTFSIGMHHLRFSKLPEAIEEGDEYNEWAENNLFSTDESDFEYFSEGEFSEYSDYTESETFVSSSTNCRNLCNGIPVSHRTLKDETVVLVNSLRQPSKFAGSSDSDEIQNVLSLDMSEILCEDDSGNSICGHPRIGRVIAYEVLPESQFDEGGVIPFNYGGLSLENFKPFKATVEFSGNMAAYHERGCSSPVSIPDDVQYQSSFIEEIHQQTGTVLESVKSELDLAVLDGQTNE